MFELKNSVDILNISLEIVEPFSEIEDIEDISEITERKINIV